jgi:hypothetical protein
MARINENGVRKAADFPNANDRTVYGLLEVRIESQHYVNRGDGVYRAYIVRPHEGVVAGAKAQQGRALKLVLIELSTGRRFASVAELRAAWPDQIRMRQAQEKRQWAYWCEDIEDPDDIEWIKEQEPMIARRKKEVADLQAKLPKLSMAEFDAAADEIKKHKDKIKELETECEKRRQAIVGLLSDLPFDADLPPELLPPAAA